VIIPPRRFGRVTPLLIIDHKTGQEDFSEPLKKPQLLSLAHAARLAYGTPPAGVVVGVLHARRRGMAAIYADRAPGYLLEEHSRKVFLQIGRIGDGSMRPGPWCVGERCPAQSVCPARDAELLKKAGDVLSGLVSWVPPLRLQVSPSPSAGTLSRPQKLGALYAVVQQAEKLATAARREIRAEVSAALSSQPAGELPELPDDGGFLTIRKSQRENLSKSSIVRAYGPLAGEKLLTKLRRDGAIEVSEVESLHIEKERGA
jgi:hypothetical protein